MTVAAELAKSSQTLHWFVCIEGIGWPDDPQDPSVGFSGDLFCIDDIDKSLDTATGSATLHEGMMLPGPFGDGFDIETMRYEVRGLALEIQDQDSILSSKIRPNSADSGVLDAAIDYMDTTIDINEAGLTSSFAEGDVVWVGGREAIKLGTRSLVSGSTYRYTSSTRGYLGTPRGRYDAQQLAGYGFAWGAGTFVYDVNPFLWDRRVILFVHVPGESASQITRMYTGRIRGLAIKDLGNTWKLDVGAELINSMVRTIHTWPGNSVEHDVFLSKFMQQTLQNASGPGATTDWFPLDSLPGWAWTVGTSEITTSDAAFALRFVEIGGAGFSDTDSQLRANALRFAYTYRDMPGGTKGALAATASAPQGIQDTVWGDAVAQIDSVIIIDGVPLFALNQMPYSDFDRIQLQAKPIGPVRDAVVKSAEVGSSVRYALDNLASGISSRFNVNGARTRNIIDVLLCFLTSMNGEYFVRSGTFNAGATIWTASPDPGFASDTWVDYTLRVIDPTAADPTVGHQIGRIITANGSAAITVGDAYDTTALGGATVDCHIRNTIYDVLPAGYGLGVHHDDIDVSSFEQMRDEWFLGCEVGGFIIADGSSEFEIIDFLIENICVPYGIQMYQDRSTGKLSARHIGAISADGQLETYTAITEASIKRVGDIAIAPRAPIASIEVKGQKTGSDMIVSPIFDERGYQTGTRVTKWVARTNSSIDEDETIATIRIPMIESAMPEHLYQSRTVRAMLNSRENAAPLLGILANRARELAIPAPEVDVDVTNEHALTLQSGSIVKLTDTTQHNPPNPLSSSRGWSGVMARLVDVEVSPDTLDIRLRVALLAERGQSALIAPAALVSSKGVYGSGAEYFVVGDDDFTTTDLDDWSWFAVNDLIELRDSTGALKESETIKSFGANEADTPGGASTSTVNVAGTITSSIATGDYITFAPWVTATKTTNMAQHAAQAGTDDLIDADDAKVWV